MQTRLVRSLVFAFSLSLVLPPGWCCMVPRAAAEEAAPCCGCHECAQPDETPADDAPAPMPPGSNRCPCFDRQTTAPDTYKPQTGYADLAALISVPTVVLPAPHANHVERHLTSLGDQPLYLVHCFLRC
jgi:hypothetical protein